MGAHSTGTPWLNQLLQRCPNVRPISGVDFVTGQLTGSLPLDFLYSMDRERFLCGVVYDPFLPWRPASGPPPFVKELFWRRLGASHGSNFHWRLAVSKRCDEGKGVG
jgi:hypothetical protein